MMLLPLLLLLLLCMLLLLPVLDVAPTHGIAVVAVVPAAPAIDAIAAVPASSLAQYDLPRHFQPKIDNMNLNIYKSIRKKGVFFKDSPQQRIIQQNFGLGYIALYQLIAGNHQINSTCLALIV